jgi:hypothetical protein
VTSVKISASLKELETVKFSSKKGPVAFYYALGHANLTRKVSKNNRVVWQISSISSTLVNVTNRENFLIADRIPVEVRET